MTPSPPLILIDGSGWLYRAHFGMPPLSNSLGEPTGVVFGMATMIKRLLEDYAASDVVMIFDAHGGSFRNQLSPTYKAQRPPTPEDIVLQFPWVVELCLGLGLPVLQVEGVEADDVIGTLTTNALKASDTQEVVIVTGDKDLAQLVNERVWLLDTMKNRKMTVAGVEEKFGVRPEQIIDFLTLMGDASDNIQGVTGVGEKTAAKLLKEHGSLDVLMNGADYIKGKLGENLRAARAHLPLSKQLATIVCDVPLPTQSLARRPQDPLRLKPLYERLDFNKWASEVGKAAPSPVPPAPSLPSQPTVAHTVLTPEDLAALCQALQGAEAFAIDTETTGLDSQQARLVGLAFAVTVGEGWYLPLAHDYLGAPDQLPLTDVQAALLPILQDEAKAKIGQNLKYDLHILRRHGLALAGPFHDTMLQSYVLDAASRHDMDTLALSVLNHTTIKFESVVGKGKGQLLFSQVALEQAAPYAAEDADITLRLHLAQHPRLTGALKQVYDTLEIPLLPVLTRMEQNGMAVEVPSLNTLAQELAEKMEALQKQAFIAAETEFNLGSPKQLQEILYGNLGLEVRERTPKGDPSTAESALEDLRPFHPLPGLILDWRGMQKLRSTYAEALPKQINPHTGRIHSSFHQAVASTGRLSSSDPNLQNIPVRTAEGRRIRQAFVGMDGKALLSMDYSQIELRLMAHMADDERLIEAFRQDKDIHQATAAEVFGLTEVSSEQRRAAKAVNFGIIYGISAFGLARQLNLPRHEADDIIKRFFARYPKVKAYMDSRKTFAREQGYVETLSGRRLYLKDIHAKSAPLRQYAERTAINAPLQGTAADIIKLAMIAVQHWLDEHAPSVKMVLQVHDELVFEGEAALLHEIAPQLGEQMVRVMPLSVPLVVDYGIGLNWDAAHQGEARVRG